MVPHCDVKEYREGVEYQCITYADGKPLTQTELANFPKKGPGLRKMDLMQVELTQVI